MAPTIDIENEQTSDTVSTTGEAALLLQWDSVHLKPGDIVNAEYRIEAEIGAGGFAHVYRARSLKTERRVALKVLDPQFIGTQMATRFAREAKAISSIQHPHVVEILDFAVSPDGRPFIVMELLEGGTLRQALEARGRFSPHEGLAIAIQISAALGAAHALGIVHRDVKCGNVILVPGDTPQSLPTAKLLDFGIAKFLEADGKGLTARNQLIGSALTMAPEQICGMPVDARTDIYALGIVIFQLFTGRYPFRSRDGDVHQMHLASKPPRPSEFAPLPAAIDALVLRCLAKQPEARFQSIEELIAAMNAVAATLVPEDSRGTTRSPAVAVYLELLLEEFADDSAETLLAMSELTEQAEALFAERGFSMCIQSGTAILGAKVARDSIHRARIEEDAFHLATALRALDPVPPDVKLLVRISAGDAEWDPESGEISGGPILSLDSWPEHP